MSTINWKREFLLACGLAGAGTLLVAMIVLLRGQVFLEIFPDATSELLALLGCFVTCFVARTLFVLTGKGRLGWFLALGFLDVVFTASLSYILDLYQSNPGAILLIFLITFVFVGTFSFLRVRIRL